MRLSIQLALLLAAPMLAAGFLAGSRALDARSTAAEMGDITEFTRLGVRIGDFVHESQRERGLTAGFLGAKGTESGAELTAQRRQTDSRLGELRKATDLLDRDGLAPAFAEAIDRTTRAAEGLTQTRLEVDGLSIEGPAAVAAYTEAIAAGLDAISAITARSTSAEINRQIGAYAGLLRAKEFAGQERALLNGSIRRGSFGPGAYERFVGLAARQEAYISVFLDQAGDHALGAFNHFRESQASRKVEEIRAAAAAQAADGALRLDAGESFAAMTRKIDGMKEVEDLSARLLIEQAEQARDRAKTTATVFVAVAGAVLAVIGATGTLAVRGIVRRLGSATSGFRQAAENRDLTVRLDDSRGDEIGTMAGQFNTFVGAVAELVTRVIESANSVAAAATEVAASAEEISAGLSEQQSQTQEVAGAVTELAASVTQVAQTTRESASESDRAETTANAGREAVDAGTRAMNEIAESVRQSSVRVQHLGEQSESIGQIVAVINDIADQTNLLALNAAIEAARAGEHGRGFAVVADEVRKLAERTAQATDEVGRTVRSIQDETKEVVRVMDFGASLVNEGTRTSHDAAERIEGIVGSVRRVREMVATVASSTDQQASASEQVSVAMQRIAAIASESSDGSRQAAQASEDLSRKAEDLMQIATRFRVA